MPIYGVGDTLKPPYYGVRNVKKLPTYGVGDMEKCRFMALETPLNHVIMALEISKTPDLWR